MSRFIVFDIETPNLRRQSKLPIEETDLQRF